MIWGSRGMAEPSVGRLDAGRARGKAKIPELSARQLEIAQWIAEGKPSASIATILGLSVNTVEYYKKEIFKKWKITSIAQLCVRLAFADLISNPWKEHNQ